MKKYTVKVMGLAQVVAYVDVEADDEKEAEGMAMDPEVLMEVEWEYDGIQESLYAFPFPLGQQPDR